MDNVLIELYDKYDAAKTKKEKRIILQEILNIDQNDIDSMHRLIDLLPEKKQMEALLELKPKAFAIASSFCEKDDDFYLIHEARPYVFLLEDLLERYENSKMIDEAYEILQEMIAINPGDNLGERFHLVAYFIGKQKRDDLRAFVEKCEDKHSVALRFAQLYLESVNKKTDDFKSLFDEFPYLYALLSKEISLKKYQVERMKKEITYYRPGGFFECLLFYEMLLNYNSTLSMSFLNHKCSYGRGLPKYSITSLLPKGTKAYVFALTNDYDNTYERFVKSLEDYNLSKEQFEKDVKQLEKMLVLERDKNKIYFNEATYPLIIYYLQQTKEEIEYISYVVGA